MGHENLRYYEDTEQRGESLTSRQQELLKYVAEGFSRTDIAANMAITLQSVKNSLAVITKKVGGPTPEGNVYLAVQTGQLAYVLSNRDEVILLWLMRHTDEKEKWLLEQFVNSGIATNKEVGARVGLSASGFGHAMGRLSKSFEERVQAAERVGLKISPRRIALLVGLNKISRGSFWNVKTDGQMYDDERIANLFLRV